MFCLCRWVFVLQGGGEEGRGRNWRIEGMEGSKTHLARAKHSQILLQKTTAIREESLWYVTPTYCPPKYDLPPSTPPGPIIFQELTFIAFCNFGKKVPMVSLNKNCREGPLLVKKNQPNRVKDLEVINI